MVSLWGSKKNDDAPDSENTERPHSGRVEPTERTRLLAGSSRHTPPLHSDGFLDPDDPAVSPYNLWTVRFIRYLTVIFTMITFVWWVLLLVSIFVSPPGMNTPGSGYTDFSYTTLTLGNLLVALLFFVGPSRAMRISMGVVSFLLLVDMIIILAVPRIRHEEAWVGIASAIWATLIAAWCVITDRVVAWGKREEEERLTGRPETRRTLQEWLGVLISTVITVIYIIIVVFMTGTLILRAMDAGKSSEGSRLGVDGGKYNVHFVCVGNKTDDSLSGSNPPTILLEAGEQPSELDFEGFLYEARGQGTISRYCYWDRPGYAYSDDAPSPHSAGMSADVLAEVLAIAGEDGPFISVSAGYGSIIARIFASRHSDKVTGLMLVDPLHEDLLYRVGDTGRGFELWGWGILSPLGIRRIFGSLFSSQTVEDRLYGDAVWQTGKFLKAKLQENLVAKSITSSEISTSRQVQSTDTPLVVISSGIETGRDKLWKQKQENLSKLTKNLVSWDVVSGAPHEVWKSDKGKKLMQKRLGELVKAASNGN